MLQGENRPTQALCITTAALGLWLLWQLNTPLCKKLPSHSLCLPSLSSVLKCHVTVWGLTISGAVFNSFKTL